MGCSRTGADLGKDEEFSLWHWALRLQRDTHKDNGRHTQAAPTYRMYLHTQESPSCQQLPSFCDQVFLSPPSNQDFFLVALPSHECLKYPICQEHWLSPLYLISYWSFSGSQFKCHFPERLLSPLRKSQSPLLYSPYIFFLSGNFHLCNFASICLISWLMTFCLENKNYSPRTVSILAPTSHTSLYLFPGTR